MLDILHKANKKSTTKALGYASLLLGITVLAYLAASIHPVLPLIIIAMSWLTAFAVKNPFVILLLFLIFTMGRLSELAPILAQLSLGKLLILFTIVVFILSKILERDYSIVYSPHNKWILFLLGAVIVSIVLGRSNSHNGFQLLKGGYIKVLIFYFLILNLVKTPKQALIFQLTLTIIVALLGAYALLGKILGTDPLTGQALVEGSRAAMVGSLDDPNDLSLVLLMPLPFCVIGMLDLKGWKRITMTILAITIIAGIISTQSRGGLLGLFAVIAILLNRKVKNKLILVTVLSSFVLLAVIAAGITERRTTQMQNSGLDDSASDRLTAWQVGIEMFAHTPIWGIGFSGFVENSQHTRLGLPLEPHNTLVKVLAETGLLGFIPFAMLLYLTIKNSLALGLTVKNQANSFTDAMKSGAFPCFMGFMVSAFFLTHAWTSFIYIFHAQIGANFSIFDPENDNSYGESK